MDLGSKVFGVDHPGSPRDRSNKLERNRIFEITQELRTQGIDKNSIPELAKAMYTDEIQRLARTRPDFKAAYEKEFADTLLEYESEHGVPIKTKSPTAEQDAAILNDFEEGLKKDKKYSARLKKSKEKGKAYTEDIQEESDKKKPHYYEMWYTGLSVLEKEIPGIRVVYTGKGNFGGVEFGIPKAPTPIKGINYPVDFYYLACSDKMQESVVEAIQAIDCPMSRNFWMSIVLGGNTSPLSKFAKINESIDCYKTITASGASGAFKYVPPMSWFDEKLQNIDVKKLLGILPKAEQHTMLLQIGRIAAGVNKQLKRQSELVELRGEFSYHHRLGLILTGEAEIGKSTLLNYLLTGMEITGYTYGTIDPDINRFTFSEAINDDAIVVDDATQKGIASLVENNKVKSVISGGIVSDERKGVDPTKALPRCAFIMCANINMHQLPSNIDDGVLNRLHVLQIFNSQQIKEREEHLKHPIKTYEYWQHMVKETGTSIEALSLLLFRHGLDYFLSETGVVVDEQGNYIQEHDKNKINQTLKELRSRYSFQIPGQAEKVLPVSARKADALATILGKCLNIELEMPEEYDETFNGFTVYHLAKTVSNLNAATKSIIKLIKDRKDDMPIEVKDKLDRQLEFIAEVELWLGATSLIQVSNWKQFVSIWNETVGNDCRIGANKVTFASIWDKTQHLEQKSGNPIPKERSKYAAQFGESQSSKGGYMVELKRIIEKYKDSLSKNLLSQILTHYPVYTLDV
jgi:Family of unknown function (DUF5906)